MTETVLHCPHCGDDIPDPDLSQIIRFYDGDMGVGARCPRCAATVAWKMTIAVCPCTALTAKGRPR